MTAVKEPNLLNKLLNLVNEVVIYQILSFKDGFKFL